MGGECLKKIASFPTWKNQKYSHSLVQKPPLSSCEVCVILPVRNEAETLENTLTALAEQTDLTGECFDFKRYEIILLANNCSDNSAAIARRFAQQHPTLALHVVEITLPANEAYIGRVRQILMDEAYRRLISIKRIRGVIASTDGDTRVTPNWIAATLNEIACGADAVGGRILTESVGRFGLDSYARACYLKEVGYRYLIAELETYLDPDPVDAWPRHYQHYGASLAVTAQMYKQAGGLPPVETPEDVAFYDALRCVDARFRHSPLVRVFTSARQTGRTNIGLANQLSEWTTMGQQNQPFLVEPATVIETRLRLRHQLRVLWWRSRNGYQPINSDVIPLANLGVDPAWLIDKLMSPTFGLLLESIEQYQQQTDKKAQHCSFVEIGSAISDLRIRLDYLRRNQDQHKYKCDRPQSNQITQASTYTKPAQTNQVDILTHADVLDAVV